jgi:hypothetical protein
MSTRKNSHWLGFEPTIFCSKCLEYLHHAAGMIVTRCEFCTEFRIFLFKEVGNFYFPFCSYAYSVKKIRGNFTQKSLGKWVFLEKYNYKYNSSKNNL